MKYGLLVFPQSDNVGDDIQSYAALQFLPQVDYYIDREQLDTFRSKNHEPVAMIMNAWYMHNKFNWPPAQDIYPLLISMHLSEGDHLGIGTKFLQGMGGEYCKKYGPVGCRDYSTLQMLQQLKIDGYFSGCMTLTLPKQKKSVNTLPYICAVDVDEEVQAYLKNKVANSGVEIKVVSHDMIPADGAPSWPERMQRVEKQLEVYQNANCVVTTRLHVALPCLAMEVPVLLLYDAATSETDRLDTFATILHHATRETVLAGEGFDLIHPPKNPTEYLSIREALIQKCTQFVQRMQGKSSLPMEEETYNELLQKVIWQKHLIIDSVFEMMKRVHEQRVAMQDFQAGKDWLEEQYNNHLTEIERLDVQCKNQHAEVERLDVQCKNQHAEVERLDVQCRNRLAEIEQLKDEKANLTQRLQTTELELTAMKNRKVVRFVDGVRKLFR